MDILFLHNNKALFVFLLNYLQYFKMKKSCPKLQTFINMQLNYVLSHV